MQTNNQVIIKLAQSCVTDPAISKQVGRITGLIDASNFHKLMGNLTVESNPRQPKESAVTKEIIETLRKNPERFHLMSKGLLLSTSSCETLERNRFRLSFDHKGYAQPGILDGGHNTFAIAKHILSYAYDEGDLRGVKDWDSLLIAWAKESADLASLFKAVEGSSNSTLEFNFLVPIEIIFPQHPDDEDQLEIWGDSHRDITHARNNNVQLTDSTKDNHQGFYTYLRESLLPEVSDRVEWKTNDGGEIKVADIAALALIALSKLDKAELGLEINLPKIYNSKQYCVETFRAILEKEGNGTWKGQTYELANPTVQSALKLVSGIVEAYDEIYCRFPDAYNAAGGKFGRIDGIRIFDPSAAPDGKKYAKKPFETKYFQRECNYSYADGFIIPLVVGLRELIEIVPEDNSARWVETPTIFIGREINGLLAMYSALVKMANWDPQKIGKDKGSYEFAANAIRMKMPR